MICKICGRVLPTKLAESLHIKTHDYSNLLTYYVEQYNFVIPKCSQCDNDAKLYTGIVFRKTCGDSKCIHAEFKNRKYSDTCRKNMSDGMKLAHKEGRSPGWTFINSDSNHRSYPEKWFIKNVLQKYNLYEKYTIKEKFPFEKYFLDFAIIDLKIDIEIDGSQHFRNEKNIHFDKNRDSILLSNGWSVYRIAWKELVNNRESTVTSFVNWLIDRTTNYRKYDADLLLMQLDSNKPKPKYGNREAYGIAKKQKTNDKYKSLIIKIINEQTIDFSKFGWVDKVSKIIGVQPARVNRLMKRVALDFYESTCFKRKTSS